MIVDFKKEHVKEITDVHLRSFPNFFLTFLGSRFLKTYYEGIVKYPYSIKFAFLQEGHVTGFITGVRNPSSFYSYLIRNDAFRFVFASLMAVARRPIVTSRIVRALKTPSAKRVDSEIVELTSIGVLPEFQGSGIGGQLMHAFLEKCREQKIRKIYLTTDAEANDRVNDFYKSQGFSLSRTFLTPEKRLMNEYVYELNL